MGAHPSKVWGRLSMDVWQSITRFDNMFVHDPLCLQTVQHGDQVRLTVDSPVCPHTSRIFLKTQLGRGGGSENLLKLGHFWKIYLRCHFLLWSKCLALSYDTILKSLRGLLYYTKGKKEGLTQDGWLLLKHTDQKRKMSRRCWHTGTLKTMPSNYYSGCIKNTNNNSKHHFYSKPPPPNRPQHFVFDLIYFI